MDKSFLLGFVGLLFIVAGLTVLCLLFAMSGSMVLTFPIAVLPGILVAIGSIVSLLSSFMGDSR